jgi:hypothetical protein
MKKIERRTNRVSEVEPRRLGQLSTLGFSPSIYWISHAFGPSEGRVPHV